MNSVGGFPYLFTGITESVPVQPGSRALGVGHDEDAIAEVRGTNGARWDTLPFRIVPDGCQVPKYSSHARRSSESSIWNKEAWDVLHKDCSRSKNANGVRVTG